MCHMLIFVKSKNIYFKHIYDVLFEIFSNPPLHRNIEDRGIIFLLNTL